MLEARNERILTREAVISADHRDQTPTSGSITLKGENGSECPEGNMLRQEGGTKETTEKSSAMAIALAESEEPVNTQEVATLAGSPAIFCYLAESSDVIGNTGEDLRSGEVYDAMQQYRRTIRAHGWSGSMGTVMSLRRI